MMNTLRNPTASAAEPKIAVAMPPIPKLTPKKTPEIKPTCVGAALSAQTRMAEKADAGRIRAYRRNVGTQRIHGTAHADVARRAVQVFGRYIRIFIRLLRKKRRGRKSRNEYHC